MSLTPFTSSGWVRSAISVNFEPRPPNIKTDFSALAAVVSGWAGKTTEQKEAAALLYLCRRCIITVRARQECQTASFRNSDITPFLAPDTAVVPAITIPDGLGGAIPSGKYVLQSIECDDTGDGGKSVVTAVWEQRKEWVLVKNQP